MNIEDVNPLKDDGTPKSQEEIAAEVAGGASPSAPGSRTDSALLLKSLQEERQKRKDLEEELELLKKSPASSEVFTEEGKALQRKIDDQDAIIKRLVNSDAKKDLLVAYPILSQKWEDFETFRSDPENQGMSMNTSAKAFLIENSLLDKKRPGMERPTGGDRQPTSTKMSAEDVRILRETNPRKHLEFIQKGIITGDEV